MCLLGAEINTMVIQSHLLACCHKIFIYRAQKKTLSRWVKRFSPGDPPPLAALLSHTSSQFPNIFYFLPTRLCRWFLRQFSRYHLISFLISLFYRSRYLKQIVRVWLLNPLAPPQLESMPLPNLSSLAFTFKVSIFAFFSAVGKFSSAKTVSSITTHFFSVVE